jgi:hypothetical protein
MSSANDQRLRATQMAQEGIQSLLDAGISFKRVAEAYAAAAATLVLQHADIEAVQDLLVSLHRMLDMHEETTRHDHAST